MGEGSQGSASRPTANALLPSAGGSETDTAASTRSAAARRAASRPNGDVTRREQPTGSRFSALPRTWYDRARPWNERIAGEEPLFGDRRGGRRVSRRRIVHQGRRGGSREKVFDFPRLLDSRRLDHIGLARQHARRRRWGWGTDGLPARLEQPRWVRTPREPRASRSSIPERRRPPDPGHAFQARRPPPRRRWYRSSFRTSFGGDRDGDPVHTRAAKLVKHIDHPRVRHFTVSIDDDGEVAICHQQRPQSGR